MKQQYKRRPKGKFLLRTTLFVMSLFAAVFFFMPSALLGANITLIVSPDGPSDVGTNCTVTATAESDWCFNPDSWPVSFEVSGANSLIVKQHPVSGRLSWTYEGEKAGSDTISATWHIPDCSSRSRTGTFMDLRSTLEKEWLQPGITMEISPESICIDLDKKKRVPCMDVRKRMKGTRWLKLVGKVPEGLAVTARDVNIEKIKLEGVAPEPGHAHIKDVDRDGKKDLLLSFWIPKLVRSGVLNAPSEGLVVLKLTLTGETSGGTPITASVPIQIVKDNDMKKWSKDWRGKSQKHLRGEWQENKSGRDD